MHVDKYTKTVLTVIAIALSAIALQISLPSAFAQSNSFSFTPHGMLRVSVCNPRASSDGQVYCADIVNGGQLRISPQ
jgi:hypothetical protein